MATREDEKPRMYQDPLGADAEGKDYHRDWVAAKADVYLLPHGRDGSARKDEAKTGLVVLVQEDYHKAVAPVHQLGPRLVSIGLIALGAVVAVVTIQWFFVVRLLNRRARALASRSARRSGQTPMYHMTTVAAPRREETGNATIEQRARP
jgi:hypothetical protein